MKRYNLVSRICLLVMTCVTLSSQASLVSVAKYKGDREATLTFTFDDGLREHYTIVRPELKKRGLTGSFCIIGSKVGTDMKGTPTCTWDELREMAEDSLEITSHGYGHKNITTLEGEALRYDLQHNDTLIFNKVGQFPRTYCYPGNRKDSIHTLFAEQGRVGSRTFQVSLGGKRDSLWFVKWLDEAIKEHKWIVGMTHGIKIGYDNYPDPQQFYKILDVAERYDKAGRIWVATLHDALAYTKERDAAVLNVKEEEGGIIVDLSCPLDNTLYNVPLTLVIDGNYSKATQGGKALPVVHKSGKTLVDVVPGSGTLHITL